MAIKRNDLFNYKLLSTKPKKIKTSEENQEPLPYTSYKKDGKEDRKTLEDIFIEKLEEKEQDYDFSEEDDIKYDSPKLKKDAPNRPNVVRLSKLKSERLLKTLKSLDGQIIILQGVNVDKALFYTTSDIIETERLVDRKYFLINLLLVFLLISASITSLLAVTYYYDLANIYMNITGVESGVRWIVNGNTETYYDLPSNINEGNIISISILLQKMVEYDIHVEVSVKAYKDREEMSDGYDLEGYYSNWANEDGTYTFTMIEDVWSGSIGDTMLFCTEFTIPSNYGWLNSDSYMIVFTANVTIG